MTNRKEDPNRALISFDDPITKHTPQADLMQRGQNYVQSYQTAAAHLGHAVAALNARDYLGAIDAFQEALQHNRESAEDHFYLGLSYFMVGDYENAVASYKQAITCKPGDPMIYLNLEIVHQLLKRYDAAIRSYQQAIVLGPNNAEAYSQLGSAYTAQEKR